MVVKNLFKTVVREIRYNFGRFISIFLITALGVGFLAGLLSTAPDFYNSMDVYYDGHNFFDLQIKSTLGLTDGDVDAIKSLELTENAIAVNISDVIARVGEKDERVTRVYGLDMNALENDSEYINSVTLVKGKYPQNSNECLLASFGNVYSEISVGDVVTIEDEETLTVKSFTVSGIAESPLYYSIEKENSSIGKGRVEIVLFCDNSYFKSDCFTDIFLTVSGAPELDTFKNQYSELCDKAADDIQASAQTRKTVRYNEVVSQAQEEINKSEDEFNQKKESALNELSNAKSKLDSAKTALDSLEAQIKSGEEQLAVAKSLIDSMSEQAEAARAAAAAMQAAGAQVPQEITMQIAQYDAAVSEYEQKAAQLSAAKAAFEQSKAEYQAGLAQYQENAARAEDEFNDAQKQINEAKLKLEKIEMPEWYILNRDTNVSYVSLRHNVEKVDSIAKVFPLFFFLVAALVSLTTMTRMVDEQRSEIGTLKALGYSNFAIGGKYLLYSFLAGALGGMFGLAAGLIIFPLVIINVYGIMYRLPHIILSFNPQISLTSFFVSLICVIAAALAAVLGHLRESSASLMRPKAPKNGKRIILEKIAFIWKRLNFTQKVTARNLFRYKKRFLMTVLGVSGCTALLLTGFGLKDAIGDIVYKQYDEIQKYNLVVNFSDSISHESASEYIKSVSEGELEVSAQNGCVIKDGSEKEINIYVPKQTDDMSDFINLRNRKSGDVIPFGKAGVVITEKFASKNNISAGDTVVLKNSDGKTAEFTVTGICENYIYSYVYISPELYTEKYGVSPDFTTLLVKFTGENEDDTAALLLEDESVYSLSFSSAITESFKNMLGKINYIVAVLIICAGILAFVVLYNLTNINICERQKEIATLKVLGFFDRETFNYICRETYILSAIGTAVGLIIGIFLCKFVVHTAEVESLMFGKEIYAHSYIFSALISMIFTVIVNLFMSKKLKKTDMVESMKSVD